MGKRDKRKKDPEKKAAQRAAKEAKADRKAAKRLAKEEAQERGDVYVAPALRESSTRSSASGGAGDGKKEKRDKKSKSGSKVKEDDDDLDALLASYSKRNAELLSAPVIEVLDDPGWPSPPRGNFTLTTVPAGGGGKGGGGDELILFGGEFYDGVENVVFDDLLRWDPDGKRDGDDEEEEADGDKEEGAGADKDGDNEVAAAAAASPTTATAAKHNPGLWRRVRSPPPTPPARCSHSAAYHNGALYVFGGELASSDKYHHYRDLWRFDLKTNTWEEIMPRGGIRPAARSGHRTLVWRHYLILFGGFYEAHIHNSANINWDTGERF